MTRKATVFCNIEITLQEAIEVFGRFLGKPTIAESPDASIVFPDDERQCIEISWTEEFDIND